MSNSAVIIKNVFSSWVYYFTQFIIGFFLMPFMIHHLGNEIYGLWILIISFMGYMGLFDFGVRGSTVKYVSEFEAKKDFDTLNKIISTNWAINITMGILVIIIFTIASNFISLFFKINSNLMNYFKICFMLIGINMGLSLFFSVFSGVLEGYKRQDLVSGIEIIAIILQTLFIVISVLSGLGIVIIALIMLTVNILKQIARIIFSFKVCPQLKLGIEFLSAKHFKRILDYNVLVFAIDALQSLISSLPNIILGIFLGTISITFYSIASRLIGYLNLLLSNTGGVLIPFISGFDALGDKTRLKKGFMSGTRYCYILFLFAGTIFIVMGKDLIRLWVGESYIEKSYYVLLIIVLASFLSPSGFVIAPILQGMGRLKELVALTAGQVIISIILSLIFLKQIGIAGVALGCAIPYVINYGAVLPNLLLKLLNIKMKNYGKEIYMRSFFPAIILYISLSLLKAIFSPSNWIILITEIILSSIIYFFFAFKYILFDYEKTFYLSKLRLKATGISK